MTTNGLDTQRIQRLATRCKQPAPIDAAETPIGTQSRKDSPADQLTIRRQAGHAVCSPFGPADTWPQVSVAIGPSVIGKSGRHVGEQLPTTQFPPFQNLEYLDVPRTIGDRESLTGAGLQVSY